MCKWCGNIFWHGGESVGAASDSEFVVESRAETRMMQPLVTGPGKGRSARKLLRALLTSDADVIPEPEAGILRVRFLGLGSDACEQNLAPLIDELNQARTKYPALI